VNGEVFETVILPAVRYGVEFGEAVGGEHRPRVLENKVGILYVTKNDFPPNVT
jgi:hypothetical protein